MSVFSSIDPVTGAVVWTGEAATAAGVDAAVGRARAAFEDWSRTPLSTRETALRAFAGELEARQDTLTDAISREVGKPAWEARAEVRSMINKVEFSLQAHARRCSGFSHGTAITRFRPHGVVAVFGPFNFPGHLPNGHIVPALLAGNTVVFKPSEHAPQVAELTLEAWKAAGLPPGVLNLVQGGRDTGAELSHHPGIDGLFFTGSNRTGMELARLFAATPEKILALEMGGNNPLVLWSVTDLAAAALIIVQSAYLTAGQRCTCARRLILPQGDEGDACIEALRERMRSLRVGPHTDRPEPFMGPVVSARSAQSVLQSQDALVRGGATILVAARGLKEGTGLLSPGLVDVTACSSREDAEIFGPLLQVIRAPNFDAAIEEANRTRYGLTAGLLSDDRPRYEKFRDTVRSGLINWNVPLTGASSAAPFGGIGRSGNHRPSGFFAADYCAYPVASLETPDLRLPTSLPPGIAIG